MQKTISWFLLLLMGCYVAISMYSQFKIMADQTVKIGNSIEAEQGDKSSIKTDYDETVIKGIKDEKGMYQKDMSLTAAEVLSELMNVPQNVDIEINGKIINGETYHGIDLFVYLKDYNSSIVFSGENSPLKLRKDAMYSRVYMQDDNGRVKKIIYREEN